MSSPTPPKIDLREARVSIVPYRNGGDVKIHATSGLARQAVSYKCHHRGAYVSMSIWRWDFDNNEWVLEHDVPKGTKREDLPWKKESTL